MIVKLFATRIQSVLSDSVYRQLLELVTSERRTKIANFKNKGDALRSLIGEVLVRWVISSQKDIPHQTITFVNNQYGKPQIETHTDVHFNVSHSGEWVVAALNNHEVGIDIEKIDSPDMKIAEHFFSPLEYEHLRGLEDGERVKHFYKLWTLKESYIKCLGKGLSIPLNSFSITFNRAGKIELLTTENEHKTYHFSQIPFDRNYMLSVCSEVSCSATIEEITVDQLIQKMCIYY